MRGPDRRQNRSSADRFDYRARESNKARDDRRALYLFAGCGLFVVAAIALVFLNWSAPVNKLTGCPLVERTPSAHTLVLVDDTDRLSPSQVDMVEAIVRTEYGWLPRGGRLTVRNILADPDAGQDLTVCSISNGSDALGITKNRRLLEQQFKRTIGARFDRLLNNLRTAQVQKASPIIEAAEQAFDRADFGANVPNRRLVIYSDFAQSSPLLDQYKGVVRPKADELEAIQHDMSGVKVRLHYLRRPQLRRIQTPAHQAFWRALFSRQKAQVVLGPPSPLLGEDPSRPTWSRQPE